MPRVVVTGLGLITSLGNDLDTSWYAMCQGKSGIHKITSYDTSHHRVHIGGEIKDFDPSSYIERKEIRRNDLYEQLAVVASMQALQHAKLKITPENATEIGVYIGSGIGGVNTLHEQFAVLYKKGPERISPFFINMMIVDGAAGNVSIYTGAKGPNWAAVSACATSSNTIGEAWETIRRGDAKAMIAGGAEKAITPICMAAFDNIHSLSRRNNDPQRASRPFDADRDGFVMGEGSGIVILEDLDFARARHAPIIAEMVGYGTMGDAYHMTDLPPGGAGLVLSMKRALEKAQICTDEVDYINAHGTSTLTNDRVETQALKAFFGAHAYHLAASSIKSMIGHCLGASGAIEAVMTIKTVQTGIIPPTINLENADPECDLDYVPNKARTQKVRIAMSNSMGFGGHNSSLLFKKFEE